MKKKTVVRRHHAPHFYILFAAIMVIVGVSGTLVVTKVVGQTANQLISACSQKSTGNLRILAAGASCRPDENAVTWNQQGPQGLQGEAGASNTSSLPFSCNSCVLYPLADKFKGKDLTFAQLSKSEFQNSDLTGVIFKGANISNTNFTNTNLTGADFTDAGNYPGWGLANNFSNANLTNANFTNANLSGAKNMNSANITGAIWNNTNCPDGTNSNNNGNTCVGHF